MRSLMKISSEGRSGFLFGQQTQVTPNAIAINRKRGAVIGVIATLIAAFCGTASPAKGAEADTGICFRRITGFNSKGIVINRYEAVLVKRSSSLANDINRLEKFSQKGSPLNSPDMKPFTWIGASISD